VASAREVRTVVRAQIAEQVKARQDAALAVASAWDKAEEAREKLAAAERNAGAAVAAATEQLAIPDLAVLTGIPITDLRRLLRAGKDTPAPGQPIAGPDRPEPTAPTVPSRGLNMPHARPEDGQLL